MSEYTPVDCGSYARYELAILRRHRLRLTWRDPAGLTRIETVRPLDLQTRAGEEFLLIEDSAGRKARIRLDRIARSTEIPGTPRP
jgi:transcriptional antiterminator Rof (Rho-off)